MTEDPWKELRSFTEARIALGRAGGSLTTSESLRFRKDHALAKDAVWAELNVFDLENKLTELGVKQFKLSSKAENREAYIQRPDLGRELNSWSVNQLRKAPKDQGDLCIIIADGLSALAIDRHAIHFLESFLPEIPGFSLTPVCIVRQGRVAIGDHIGELLGCELTVILIGERPGLSSPDSLGIYMTYNPKRGNTDEKRNCISNVRREGLSYEFAAKKLGFLIRESLTRKISGIGLKDNFDHQIGK